MKSGVEGEDPEIINLRGHGGTKKARTQAGTRGENCLISLTRRVGWWRGEEEAEGGGGVLNALGYRNTLEGGVGKHRSKQNSGVAVSSIDWDLTGKRGSALGQQKAEACLYWGAKEAQGEEQHRQIVKPTKMSEKTES